MIFEPVQAVTFLQKSIEGHGQVADLRNAGLAQPHGRIRLFSHVLYTRRHSVQWRHGALDQQVA